jgi:hypothetical protein
MGLFDKLLAKKPSYEEFAREMVRSLERLGAHDLRHDPASRSLQVGSADATLYLDNAFSDFVSAPASERPEILQRYAASFTRKTCIPDDYSACKSQLLPVVRDPAYYGLTRLMIKAKGGDDSQLDFATRELAPGLCIGIAHDTPNNIATVSALQLAKWKVTPDQAFEQSLSNLREKSTESRFKELGAGFYVGDWDDSYDTSRILFPELFHRLSLDGDPVVFLPNRDTLFVTGAYNTAALAVILQHGSTMHFEQGHALSPNCYVHTSDRWSIFTPEDPVVSAAARAVRYKREFTDYEQQKNYLEELHKREKLDLFVATFQIVRRKDDSLFTRCIWSNGVDSLLPVAENLVLGVNVQTKDILSLPWDVAWPIVSPLLEKVPNLAPIRYRARTVPSPDQIQALRKLSS